MQHRRGLRLRPQGRTALAQMHLQAHHQLFAQRIDRRSGDLGETLLEVVEEQVGLAREHRQGDVIPHAVGRLLASTGHVFDDEVQVFGAEARGALQLQQLQIAEPALLLPGLGAQVAALLSKPFAIGMAAGRFGLDLPVAQQPTTVKVDRQHLAGAKTALFDDAAFLKLDHAGLRTHHHVAIAGDAVAGRTQSVAIQGGADGVTIGEHQQGRTIPGLLQAGVVLVHRPDLRLVIEFGLIPEGLGHQGQQAVGDRPAAAHEQLERGVEVGRIAEGRIHQGPQVAGGIAPDRFEVGLGGTGPVDVAQQGVDLTVVPEQPHRLGQGPAGQGVGAEATVVHRKTDRKPRIAQVAVEVRQHLRTHHAFVDNGATADRSEIKVAADRSPDRPGAVDGTPPQAKQPGLEGIAIDGGVSADQPMDDVGSRVAGERAEHAGVDRHIAPAQAAQAEGLGFLFAELDGLGAANCIGGQKHRGQSAQLTAGRLGGRPDRLVIRPGNGAEHAGAVARIAVAATPAAVLHAVETAQGLLQHPVAGFTTQMGQKAHATGILFPAHRRRSGTVAMGPDGLGESRHGPGSRHQ